MKINMIIPLLLLSNAFNVPNNLVPNSNLVKHEPVSMMVQAQSSCHDKVCVKNCCDDLKSCKTTNNDSLVCQTQVTACLVTCRVVVVSLSCSATANCDK